MTRAIAFHGGRILTMDPHHPDPEVVVVSEGRIAAVGERAALDAWPGAESIGLDGRTLVPGFVDSHNHLSLAALHPLWADVSEATDVEGVLVALKEQAAREPDVAWVRGAGWGWRGEFTLTARDIDSLDLGRPVIVAHFSYHQCVVDSRALEELGIGRDTPDPEGGLIERDPSGQHTGRLVERAWGRAHARSVEAYADPDLWPDLIAAQARILASEGITCVHDAAVSPGAEVAYRTLASSGRLPISVLMLPHPLAMFEGLPQAQLDGPVTGDGDEWLRTGPVKLFADGGVLPSVDATLGGQRVKLGYAFPDLAEQAHTVVSRGFRVAVHAMGNEGLARTLDAFEGIQRSFPDRDHRSRVEHVTLASSDQIRRVASLGAVGVVQPGFVGIMGPRTQGVSFDDVTWLPFASLLRSGATMAGSSDAPCGFWEPIRVASMGATRKIPDDGSFGLEESVSFEEWLRAYTVSSAYAGGQEHERGRIAPDLRADLVVLDGPLEAEPPPVVAETWVAGQRVYRR